MPNYKVIVRGGLALTNKLEQKKPEGSIVQLSEEDAASLPPGTVELVKPEAPKKSEGK